VLLLEHIAFACADPRGLAAFWAAVLGYEARANGDGWRATPTAGDDPPLVFRRSPRSPTVELPIHLDVNAPHPEAEVERLLGSGARLVATKREIVGDLDQTWTVLRDPEGNGFCVQGPDTRRPGPFIWNITFACPAPRKLGPFWSSALGWPEQIPSVGFLQMLWDAGLGRAEEEAYYAALSPDGSARRLLFQRRERSRPERYPIHLEFTSGDVDAETARLMGLGATVVADRDDGEPRRAVLRDPEGNPFGVAAGA
jgi:predicted enzyme related to lactoylglutathione lyase